MIDLKKSYSFNSYAIFMFCICLFFFSLKSGAQSKEIDTYIEQLNTEVQGFTLKDSNFKGSFLSKGSFLNDKLIIGMGESTHGTKEFNQLRFKLIKELILSGNLKLIAFESDYSNSLILNKYLLGEQKDSLLHYVSKSGLYGVYRTQEVYDMLLWIKEYNLKKPYQDRVQFLGIDMQDPYSIARKITDLFPQLSELDIESFKKFEELKKISFANKLKTASKEEKIGYKQVVTKISELAVKNSPSTDTLELAHCIQLLSQSLNFYDDAGFFTKVDDWYRNLRDGYMAENVLWLLKNKANGGKMALWAHNGHIAHAKLDNTYRMGYHLQQALGTQYYAMGLTFDEGSVRILDYKGTKKYRAFDYPSSVFPNSYEFVLKKCSPQSFFIDIPTANKNKTLATFFDRFQYSRVIGAVYQPDPKKDYFKQPLTECFDGLVFFKTATAAENINASK